MSTSLLERLHTAWLSLAQGSPLPWLVLTMLVYLAAMAIYRKSGNRPMLIPVFTGVVVIVAILLLTGTPYETYRSGVSLLGLMIGPATVAPAIRSTPSASASVSCGCPSAWRCSWAVWSLCFRRWALPGPLAARKLR